MSGARWIRPALLAMLFCACFAMGARADEPSIYTFPEVEPSYAVKAGYRFVGLEGSERAIEYEHPEGAPYLGIKAVVFPLPHRIYLEIEGVGDRDYFADLGYAYGDKLVSRWVRRSIYHNLENIELVELSPIFAVDRRDGGEDYGVQTVLDDVYLRGKPLNFPFHIYATVERSEKRGTAQQRFLAGAGNFTRTSRERDIDWTSDVVTLGANSHLGVLEIDYAHSEKRFRPGGDDVMSDLYATGTYPHNVVSETEGSTDTVKVHTSYTGRVTASATFSRTHRENTTSDAEADYDMAQGELTIVPTERAMLALKYRRLIKDTTTPDTLPAQYLGFPAFTTATAVARENISTTEETYEGLFDYHVTRSTMVGVNHRIRQTGRRNNGGWNVPDTTTRRETRVFLRTRLPWQARFRAHYQHVEQEDPAYNSEPERADSGMLYLSMSPSGRALAVLVWEQAHERRSSLKFADSRAEDRSVRRQGGTAMFSYMVGERSTLSASYAFMQRRVRQDLYYETVFSNNVEYKETAHIYSLGFNHTTKTDLALHAGVSRTTGMSRFDEDGVDSFSELGVRQTRYELGADYRGTGRFGYCLEGKYLDFDDTVENDENPAMEDGSAWLVLAGISASW